MKPRQNRQWLATGCPKRRQWNQRVRWQRHPLLSVGLVDAATTLWVLLLLLIIIIIILWYWGKFLRTHHNLCKIWRFYTKSQWNITGWMTPRRSLPFLLKFLKVRSPDHLPIGPIMKKANILYENISIWSCQITHSLKVICQHPLFSLILKNSPSSLFYILLQSMRGPLWSTYLVRFRMKWDECEWTEHVFHCFWAAPRSSSSLIPNIGRATSSLSNAGTFCTEWKHTGLPLAVHSEVPKTTSFIFALQLQPSRLAHLHLLQEFCSNPSNNQPTNLEHDGLYLHVKRRQANWPPGPSLRCLRYCMHYVDRSHLSPYSDVGRNNCYGFKNVSAIRGADGTFQILGVCNQHSIWINAV